MAEGGIPISPQSPEVLIDPSGQVDEISSPSTGQVEHRTPYRIILQGDGLSTWDGAVMRHLMVCNPQSDGEQLKTEVMQAINDDEKGCFYSNLMWERQVVTVMRCPTKVNSKNDIRGWIEWWIKLLKQWNTGRIEALVSPSAKYNSIVKMTARKLQVDCVLVKTEGTKATSKYKEHHPLLNLLATLGAKLREGVELEGDDQRVVEENQQHKEPDESEEVGTSRESGEEGDETTLQGTQENQNMGDRTVTQGAATQEDWSPYRVTGHQSAAPAAGQQSPQRAPEHQPAKPAAGGHRKAKKKSDGSSREERLSPFSPLPPMPEEAKKRSNQSGTHVYYWIGSPWEIEGDALIVVTNTLLQVHNSRFHKDLQSHTGADYQQEVEVKRRGWEDKTASQKQALVTSGVLLPYFVVIHVPLREYSAEEELLEYQEEMVCALERGIDRANEQGCRRVVMCVDGLRSNDLPWEQAEKVAMVVAKMQLKSHYDIGSVKELVVVASQKQDKERRRRALMTFGKEQKKAAYKYAEETRDGTSDISGDETRQQPPTSAQQQKASQGTSNDSKVQTQEPRGKEDFQEYKTIKVIVTVELPVLKAPRQPSEPAPKPPTSEVDTQTEGIVWYGEESDNQPSVVTTEEVDVAAALVAIEESLMDLGETSTSK